MNMEGGLKRLFKFLFVSKMDDIPFIVFVSFLFTFIAARSYVYMTKKDILTNPLFIEAIYIRGIHVHHLNIGIVLMALCGFIALYDLRQHIHRVIAVVYGIGLALTFDEFALWLLLEDRYHARITYDAIIIITFILLNIVYFPSFWRKRGKNVMHLVYSALKRIKINV